MAFINALLNKISDFKCKAGGEEAVFPGILQEENGNIILNAKFPLEQYRKTALDAEFAILGNVSGRKITLMGCHIETDSWSMGDDCFSISVIPIIAKDKYGEIQLYQTFVVQWSVNSYKHKIVSVVEYFFNVPMPLMEAVAKISATRSLFSFFGDGYIPFDGISFEIDADENKCDLWLNYKDDVPAINKLFLIETSVFQNQFPKIWESWLELYESASPFYTLFYEIVCNRSTKVNGFLNLSQAIEVYSNAFRNEQASEIAGRAV